MIEDTFESTEAIGRQPLPPCPICGDSNRIRFYGEQGYIVGEKRVPSVILRCPGCDLNFRRFDRPVSEVLSHFEVAPYSSDEVEQLWRRRREGFYHFLLDMLAKPAAGKRLLDIGCAFGHFLDCAVEHGYVAFGSEISEPMAALARQRTDYPISGRPLSDLQLPEQQFDVVTFIDSFCYNEDPLAVLRQCRKLIKPGGELMIRVTNRNQMARLYLLMRKLTLRGGQVAELPYWTTDDAICCLSRGSLIELMKRTGFRITKLTCLERGKKIDLLSLKDFHGTKWSLGKRIDSLALGAFRGLTRLIALGTFERVCFTPGVACVARAE
jgi:2-polyprenyl-3-methyl-5-hydroxy-6-metoxy-1,4-benzoquinol methylase